MVIAACATRRALGTRRWAIRLPPYTGRTIQRSLVPDALRLYLGPGSRASPNLLISIREFDQRRGSSCTTPAASCSLRTISIGVSSTTTSARSNSPRSRSARTRRALRRVSASRNTRRRQQAGGTRCRARRTLRKQAGRSYYASNRSLSGAATRPRLDEYRASIPAKHPDADAGRQSGAAGTPRRHDAAHP